MMNVFPCIRHFLLTTALLAAGATSPWAQQGAALPAMPSADDPGAVPVQHERGDSRAASTTERDAALFYEVLTAEMAAHHRDFIIASALLLEAARRMDATQPGAPSPAGDATGGGDDAQRLFHRAAQMAIESRSGPQALMAARQWQQARPHSREANRYLLHVLLTLNRVADTREALAREIASVSAQDKSVLYLEIAQSYATVSNRTLAADVVQAALEADVRNPATAHMAWALIGHMRLQSAQDAAARAALMHSHAARPYNAAAALLALEMLENGHTAAAAIVQGHVQGLDVPRDAVPAQGNPAKTHGEGPSPDFRLAYARVLTQRGHLQPALAQIRAVLDATPENAAAWMELAQIHAQYGDWERTLQALRSHIPLVEQLPEAAPHRTAQLQQAYLLGARAAFHAGRSAQAAQWLQRMDAQASTAAMRRAATVLRAQLLAQQGQVAAGRALLLKAAAQEDDPQQAQAWQLADVQYLRDTGNVRQAWRLQHKLHQREPDNPELAYDAAILAEQNGQLGEMERLLRGIIAQQADYHHAHNALGYALAERGLRLGEARRLIETALSYAPDDPHIIDSIGWLEYRAGHLDAALQWLHKAYALRHDSEIAVHLGEVLWARGEHEQARHIWRTVHRRDARHALLLRTLHRLKVPIESLTATLPDAPPAAQPFDDADDTNAAPSTPEDNGPQQ